MSGAFTVELSSAKKYGFLSSDAGKLVLQGRARKAIAPQSETDRVTALRDAVLAAPDLSAVYNFYRGESLPDEQFFINALTPRAQTWGQVLQCRITLPLLLEPIVD
ncbi:MAG: hypothetical protein M3R70_12715 [Actinomycetota bacterium]|nr:hypothetical protein [Actinomycetota bacterium]